MGIKVRLLRERDYNQVRRVDILTQKQYLGKAWNNLSSIDKENHLITRKSEFTINIKSGYCLVACFNNEILGFIFAHQDRDFKGDLYIRHIAIIPKYQGKGIGVLLYKDLIKRAQKNGLKKIHVLINLDNPSSIKLHKKVGFILKDRKEAILQF